MVLRLAASGALVLAIASVLPACGMTAANPNDGPLVQIDEVTSESGAYSIAMLAHEPTLSRGDYDLELIVTDIAGGTGVDDLIMDVVPWMPAMGHGTSIVPTVTGLGSGVYALDDADLFMPGLWQLRAAFSPSATQATRATDHATPSVTVD
jgi:hypothetical protein